MEQQIDSCPCGVCSVCNCQYFMQPINAMSQPCIPESAARVEQSVRQPVQATGHGEPAYQPLQVQAADIAPAGAKIERSEG